MWCCLWTVPLCFKPDPQYISVNIPHSFPCTIMVLKTLTIFSSCWINFGCYRVFAVCVFQAHYAVQARSRSVTRKRKREESVPPSSIARSRSCSRTPRDVSGLRDVKVSFFDRGQKKVRAFGCLLYKVFSKHWQMFRGRGCG